MIELDIKFSLETLTGLTAHPLKLPMGKLEGITYQCISDPYVDTGLAETSLVAARYQITSHILSNYAEIKRLDRVIWNMLRKIKPGYLGDTYIQYVERGKFLEDQQTLTDNSIQYVFKRDYIFYYAEDDD